MYIDIVFTTFIDNTHRGIHNTYTYIHIYLCAESGDLGPWEDRRPKSKIEASLEKCADFGPRPPSANNSNKIPRASARVFLHRRGGNKQFRVKCQVLGPLF